MVKKTKLKNIFSKDIFRNINGVIKVDQKDDEDVYTELDEYVITKETYKYFDTFFDNFNNNIQNPSDKIGVWISGFFGSGKSHFIKMLSYLLENKPIKNKLPYNFFKEKIDDITILSNIEKVINYGTKDVILFNIDSKANSIGNGQEKIVNVFMRVFNEKRGYFGDQFWIADLEEDLDYKGLYIKFKSEFKKIRKENWEDLRDHYIFEQDYIIEALVNIEYLSKEAAKNLFENDGKSYSMSIENFANKVKKYCDKKGKNHQVIFLVDEIGQYIGESTELMLNLQSVVENLGIILKGKAWVIVTSQADIDTITKDHVKSDFSKIQGRFGKPLNLSSANVDEVIRKRILDKKSEFKDELENYYNEKKIILKNLILFTDGTAEMKTYKDSIDFAETYPFIPYQFKLLQKVFDQIRITGFTGKHLAKGERSMLSAFKEATESLADKEIGSLVPFSDFYNSIESFLDPVIKRTIAQAKNNSRLNENDIKLLEILFLVKHLKEIKTNINNLMVLSIDSIDIDKIKLKEIIKESLIKLEKETLIHKSDDCYYFLTNEEQEINKEIKNQEIDKHSVRDDIFNIIFDEICPNKFESYQFNKILDDKTNNVQKADFSIRFITPLTDENPWSNQKVLSGQKNCIINSEDTVLFIFPENSEFIEQIKENKKISTYLAHNYSKNSPEIIRRILDEKVIERENLKELAKENIKTKILEARIFIDNKEVNGLSASNPSDLIKECLKRLVENIYSKSNYITSDFETDSDVKRILVNNDLENIGLGNKVNSLALKEIKAEIKLNANANVRTTLNEIRTKFMKKPFGWKEMTISGLLAILYKKDEIIIKNQQEIATNTDDVLKYLTNRAYSDKISINIREKVGEEEISSIKKILGDIIGKTNLPNSEKELFDYVKNEINNLNMDVKNKLSEYKLNEYLPGKTHLDNLSKYLDDYIFKTESNLFFKHLIETKDLFKKLLDEYDLIKNFFESEQIKIFNSAYKKLNSFENNYSYIESIEIKEKLNEFKNILKSKEPFNEIKKLHNLEKSIQNYLDEILEFRKDEVIKIIEKSIISVETEIKKHKELSLDFKKDLISNLDDILNAVKNTKECSSAIGLKYRVVEIEESIYENINQELEKIIGKSKSKTEIRRVKSLSHDFFISEKNIENEKDVKDYVKDLEKKLLELVKNQNIIIK